MDNNVEFSKMRFIYNAIQNGWTVRKLDDGRYEFAKELQKITTDVNASTFLQDVFQRWMSIDAGIRRQT
jgi:hypothetical protein